MHRLPAHLTCCFCVPAVSELHIGGQAVPQFNGSGAQFAFRSVSCGFNHTAAVVEIATEQLNAFS